MCVTRLELNEKVNALRSLKALKEIRELESSIVEFLNETAECEATDKNGKPICQYIGTDYKATYSVQTRENVNKEAVKSILTAKQFASVVTTSTFGVLRVK